MRFTFNFGGHNFNSDHIKAAMYRQHYQNRANQLIETYDYNDVMAAVKFAMNDVAREKNVSFQRAIIILDTLFGIAEDYLITRCKPLR